MSTWQINISFIKKKTENMRKMRQNAAFRIQQGENLWKLKYFSSATALQFYYNAGLCKVGQHRAKSGGKPHEYYDLDY